MIMNHKLFDRSKTFFLIKVIIFPFHLQRAAWAWNDSYCQILIYQLSKITLEFEIYFAKMIVASKALFGNIFWQVNFVK